jgi:hypothetical protein
MSDISGNTSAIELILDVTKIDLILLSTHQSLKIQDCGIFFLLNDLNIR